MFIQVILVRPERLRFAKAAVRTLVFPGINDQIIFFEMVISARKICSTALGALTYCLTFTGHLVSELDKIWAQLFAMLLGGLH